MRTIQLLVLVSAFLFVEQRASADLFVNAQLSSELGPIFCTADANTVYKQCAFTGESTFGGVTTRDSINISVLATYGDLKATIDAETGQFTGGFGEGYQLSFSDSLTVLGFSGSGFYKMNYENTSTGADFNPFNPLPDPNQLYPFTAGIPFPVSLATGGATEGQIGDAAGFMSGELLIGPFSFYDSNLRPISNYTLTSASDTAYNAVGAVPEPQTLLLLTTAAFLAFGLRRAT
jgi:hypothetical protein